jgi:DNA processing protein
MNSLFYMIALGRVPKIGPLTARNLIAYCGSAEEVFKATPQKLRKIPGIGINLQRSILQKEALLVAEKELDLLEKHNIQAWTFLDPAYPARLRHFQDSPLVLYSKGNANFNADKIVAVIGTRKPSFQGTAFCEELLAELAPYEPLVISGMAYGIDICAHRKAVELGLPTVGVLAHGLSHLYPAAHTPIARKMLDNGGLLSEHCFDTRAEKEYFPWRNRIVAGLCDALVVIESAKQGGSLITVNYANEYNKDVFAVPGRPKDPLSAGCNELIKNSQAHLLESAEDLVRIMSWDQGAKRNGKQRQLFVDLSDEEKNIVHLLGQNDATAIDLLAHQAKKSNSELASILLELEFKGVIVTLPGKRYALA